MKFFNVILISSYPLEHWACHDDAQDTLVPSHPLYCLYSMLHIQLPKNDDPNISCLTQEIPAGEDETYVPLSSSPYRLHSAKVDTQHECEHDLCLQLLSKYSHSQHCIFELSNPDNAAEHLPLIHGNDIWSPILYELLSDLLNVKFFYTLPYSKSIKFLETKVPAINCRDLTYV